MQFIEVLVPVMLVQTQPGAAGAFDTNGAATPATAPAGDATAPGTATQGAPIGGAQQPPAGGFGPMMWLLPAMLLVMILFSTMAGRKEKKKRQELMNSLQKHDKVQMLGGIIGTVSALSDDEVVVNVEDGRIRFARSAVQTILKSSNTSGGRTDLVTETKPEGKHATV